MYSWTLDHITLPLNQASAVQLHDNELTSKVALDTDMTFSPFSIYFLQFSENQITQMIIQYSYNKLWSFSRCYESKFEQLFYWLYS